MKSALLLQLTALGYGLVIPETSVFEQLETESHSAIHLAVESLEHKYQDVSHKYEQKLEDIFHKSEETFDRASAWAFDAAATADDNIERTYFAGKDWLSSVVDNAKYSMKEDIDGSLNALGIKDYSRPHHGGGHHHHCKPNHTIFEIIAKSKYTTKLAELISEHDDLVKLLNGTSANFTVFAPTDKALERILKHHPKPSKKQVKKFLSYHISDDFYPASRILASRTIPTLLEEKSLGDGNPQRLATEIGFRGLTVNFYSRVVAVNIFGTNGVIHGIDAALFPPPSAFDIINYLPGEFSTLTLGLSKTGLDKILNSTDHQGGTLFAPSNHAFAKLGSRLTGFLFSPYGVKYLKAILEYHVVPCCTLYSDALYNTTSAYGHSHGPPKGLFHVDLPTLLKDRSLSIDIARYGRLIEIKINAFNRVSVSDGIAKDGVIHVLQEVLLPPKKLGDMPGNLDMNMTIEELIDRLQPLVDSSSNDIDEYTHSEPAVDWNDAYEQTMEL